MEAIQFAGGSSIPWLLTQLESHDSTIEMEARLWIENYRWAQSILPERSFSKKEKAITAFRILGSNIVEAVPQLEKLSLHERTEVREAALLILENAFTNQYHRAGQWVIGADRISSARLPANR